MPANLSSQRSYPIPPLERRQSGDDDDDDDDGKNTLSRSSTHHSTTGTMTSIFPNSSGSHNQTLGNRSSSGAIAGGVIGGICGSALVCLFFWCWRRRNHRSRSRTLVDIDEPMYQTTSAGPSSKDLDQQLETPFVGVNMPGIRQVNHNQDDSHNQAPSAGTQNISRSPTEPLSHVQKIVSNPDCSSTSLLDKAALIAYRKGSEMDTTGPSSWKRTEAQIARSITSRTTSTSGTTSQGFESGPTISRSDSSNSPSPRRSLDSSSATADAIPPRTRHEKRPPPQVRLTIDGTYVDGRRVSDGGNNDEDEVADLQRRIQALAQENALLALRAEAPPAYH
ncbi:hypothetical protein E1B28_002556 [Marasmius oreades]|uniref:Uncharacterized protein n=1 Tax=Marasmius oreades TaxID=181124 RepID=A0A9P7UKV4_9AGAR|nr:uncharacterized protein E1B28_002556 [Marasmius oreades]KAG7086612.1 hypothetical protein E1B28_002556 [Marasmius oreades]